MCNQQILGCCKVLLLNDIKQLKAFCLVTSVKRFYYFFPKHWWFYPLLK